MLPISISFLFFLFGDNHLQKNNFMINDYVPENFCAQHFASYYFFYLPFMCMQNDNSLSFCHTLFFVCFSIYLCLLAIALLAMKKIITLLKLHSCCRSALSSTSYPFFSRSFFFSLAEIVIIFLNMLTAKGYSYELLNFFFLCAHLLLT